MKRCLQQVSDLVQRVLYWSPQTPLENIAVYSTKLLRRQRSFFISNEFFPLQRQKKVQEEQGESEAARALPSVISAQFTSLRDYQLQERHLQSSQPEETQSTLQNIGVPKTTHTGLRLRGPELSDSERDLIVLLGRMHTPCACRSESWRSSSERGRTRRERRAACTAWSPRILLSSKQNSIFAAQESVVAFQQWLVKNATKSGST